jgi:hypothetical protein
MAQVLRFLQVMKEENFVMKEENFMDSLLKKKVNKGVTTVGVAAALALVAPGAYVQAAASKTLSVSQQEMNLAEKGWSGKTSWVKRSITTTMTKLAM